MKNKKILTIIIVCVIVIIIILISLIANLIKKDDSDVDRNLLSDERKEYLNMLENPGKVTNGEKPQEVKIETLYFTVENCISEYKNNIINKDSKAIYNVLDTEYINNNQITEQNVMSKLSNYNDISQYRTKKMYSITGIKFSTYYVEGTINNQSVYFIVNIDDASKSFSISPTTQETYDKKINEEIQTNQKYENTIEKNSFNSVSYAYLSEQDIVERYFQDYLNNAIYNIERAYSTIDDEYKQKKFASLVQYKNYVNSKNAQYTSMCKNARKEYTDFSTYEEYEKYYIKISKNKLTEYRKRKGENGTEYVCKDSYENYYIFDVKSIMNYSVILDTYTIDLPEFTEKYTKASDEEKVLLNIQRCFAAINDKDYNYVYSKLDNTFKSNNFKTLADFQKYISSNFFEKNEISASNARKQGDIYMYDIKIRNEEGTKSITKTFVMRLNENTDFVMSFGI